MVWVLCRSDSHDGLKTRANEKNHHSSEYPYLSNAKSLSTSHMKRKEKLLIPEFIQVKLCGMVNAALHRQSRIGFWTKTRDEMDGCHNP